MTPFNQEDQQRLAKGIRLFNAQKYWECHEELEHCWLEEPGPVRNVYWAIIQVAASMIHYRDANLVGAQSLLDKAKQKFDRCEQLDVERDWLEKNLSWNHLQSIVREIPPGSELERFQKLFEFRFKDPDTWK